MAKDMYKGCWPVAPTPFMPNGEIDKDGMKRVIDCMIDQNVDGIDQQLYSCIQNIDAFTQKLDLFTST